MTTEEHEELLKKHLDFWECKEVQEPIINSKFPMLKRFRRTPALPKEWEGKGKFILQPEMLSPEKLQPEPKVYNENQPLICGPVFNVAFPYHRILWLPAIAGCTLEVSPVARTVWARPALDKNWYKKENLDIPINKKWLDKLLDFTRYLVNHSGSKYVVTQDLIARGPGDLLAGILGSQNMLFAMYDYPKKIKQLLSRLTDIYIEWAQAQFDLIPKFHGGYCNQYGIWAPGTSTRFQEDLAVNLSPQLFEEFLLPCHKRIVATFDYHVLHTHSGFSKLAEWALKIENLRAIEVSIDPNGPNIEELIPVWQNIQKKKPLILSGVLSQKQLNSITSKLSPRGLMLDVEIVKEDQVELFDFFCRENGGE